MKVKNLLWKSFSPADAVDGGDTPSHHSYYSSSSYSTPSSTVSSASSLQSNLSLQTLPSVPSLQTALSPDSALHLSVAHALTSSLATPPHLRHGHNSTVSSLAVHNHLLYAASGNQISVYDVSTPGSLNLLDSFCGNDPSSGHLRILLRSICGCHMRI
uniref:Uncharacterized protein n=1 Tax=Kalanchoe fedtschenkoi TaxID=63787 RepID=A0A7N0U401_KALFE